MRSLLRSLLVVAVWPSCLAASLSFGQASTAQIVREKYTRIDMKIPMRDGVRLQTIVYVPKDKSIQYPILLMRTPYGIGPYEEGKTRFSLGPNRRFVGEGYIFAYQDVRGRMMSEGDYENMRPQLAKPGGPKDIDESTDTHDTIEHLIKNVPNHNGKVGMYGISYPGFYTSAGMINAHPALKAASPQAPIADWYFDDFFHRGTFWLAHFFNFMGRFGVPRPEPVASMPGGANYNNDDGYDFYRQLGPLKNITSKYYKDQIAFWNTIQKHPNYDDFWKARNLLPHLKNVAPAVMVVGGWYDAEDLYGIFETYRAVEKQNPKVFNVLVVGPWQHGGWAAPNNRSLGHIDFGSATSEHFQEKMELAFFNHYLKGKGEHGLAEANVFETGANRWRSFDAWPPKETVKKTLHFHPENSLKWAAVDTSDDAKDEFISDPKRPVPYSERFTFRMSNEYMTDDQRFASRRPDVVTYQTEPLKEDVTIVGPLTADLFVSTTGSDADWVVKLVDVFPQGTSRNKFGTLLSGYEMHVRSEAIRGRFRNSYSKPEPFTPNQVTKVSLPLMDVCHTFKKGHRILIQVHSTWFPLMDRNPQKYVPNIFEAEESDFISATHRIHRSRAFPSSISVGVLPRKEKSESEH